MAGFTGTVQQFTEAEGRVTEVRAGMDANLSTLRDRIEATRAGWKGEAQKAFDHVMMRFDDDARRRPQRWSAQPTRVPGWASTAGCTAGAAAWTGHPCLGRR